MELTDTSVYWRLTFIDGKEYFVKTEIDDKQEFMKKLVNRGILTAGTGYISLKLDKTNEPVNIKEDKLFSFQKANHGVIGNTTKIWTIV